MGFYFILDKFLVHVLMTWVVTLRFHRNILEHVVNGSGDTQTRQFHILRNTILRKNKWVTMIASLLAFSKNYLRWATTLQLFWCFFHPKYYKEVTKASWNFVMNDTITTKLILNISHQFGPFSVCVPSQLIHKSKGYMVLENL